VRIGAQRSTVWIAALIAAFAYVAAVPSSRGADLPAPGPIATPTMPVDLPAPTPGPGDQFEGRFGVFYHGFGSPEGNTVDLNSSILTPRLNVGAPGYWAYLLPRFQLGGAVNLAGRTSFAYADVAFTLPIFHWLFFEPFGGGAIHDGSIHGTPTLSALGCPALFHAGVSLGVPITEHWNVLATWEHLSNGETFFGLNCGSNESQGGANHPGGFNQGLNNYGVSVGYAF
jgi:lipid A 3-O-deacylase